MSEPIYEQLELDFGPLLSPDYSDEDLVDWGDEDEELYGLDDPDWDGV